MCHEIDYKKDTCLLHDLKQGAGCHPVLLQLGHVSSSPKDFTTQYMYMFTSDRNPVLISGLQIRFSR